MTLTSRGKVRKPAAQTSAPATDLQAVADTITSNGQQLMEQLIEQQHTATIEPTDAPAAPAPAARVGRKLPDSYFTEAEVEALLEHITDTTLATRLASAWRLALPLNADEYGQLVAAFSAICDRHLSIADYKAATASGRMLGSLATKLRLVYGIDNLQVRL